MRRGASVPLAMFASDSAVAFKLVPVAMLPLAMAVVACSSASETEPTSSSAVTTSATGGSSASSVGGGGAGMTSAAGGGVGMGGSVGSAGGGGTAGCTEGAVVPCYEGPSGTEGIGQCAAGTAVCGSDGTLGACENQALPAFDDCATPADEDCNGEAAACTGNITLTRMLSGAVFENQGSVAFMSNGDVLVVGTTTSWNFEPYPGTLLDADGPPNHQNEVFVARMTPTGNGVFAKLLGGPGEQLAWDMVVDANDNIYILGYSDSAADFGDGMSAGASLFLLKLDAQGNLVWSRQFAHNGSGLDDSSLALDAAGNPLIAGRFNGVTMDLDFGAGPLPETDGVSVGTGTGFVAKLLADGSLAWAQSIAFDFNSASTFTVAGHPDGRVLLAGAFGGTLQLNGVTESNGPDGFFVAGLSASGAKDFIQLTPLPAVNGFGVVAAADDGTIWVAGRGINKAPGDNTFPGTSLPSGGSFVASYSAQGVFQAATGYDLVRARALAVDKAGYPILAGSFESGADFGNGAITTQRPSNLFVGKWSPQLGLLWERHAGDEASYGLHFRSVATGPNGRIAAAGPNLGTIDLGNGPVSGKTLNNDVLLGVFEP